MKQHQLELQYLSSNTNSHDTTQPAQSFESQEQPKASTSVKTFSSITGLGVYDSDAKKVGVVKEMGIQPDQSSIVLVVTRNDGTDVTVKWDDIKKIGEIVLLGGSLVKII